MINSNNQQEELVTPKNILSKILLSPKEAFIFIENYKYDKYVMLFLILSGIVRALDKAISKNMGDNLSVWGVIFFSILIGIAFGWILNYIYAASISWTGRWFNGKGNTQSILRIIAYSFLPSIISLFFLSLQILIYGNAIFQSDSQYLNEGFNAIINYIFAFIDLILIIWTIVLFVIGISVVQKISIGKAILNLILPAFLIVLSALIIFITIDLLIN
jgi:hypothetical protein